MTNPAPYALLNPAGHVEITASSLYWAQRKQTALRDCRVETTIVEVQTEGEWYWYGARPALLGGTA